MQISDRDRAVLIYKRFNKMLFLGKNDEAIKLGEGLLRMSVQDKRRLRYIKEVVQELKTCK